MYASHPISSCQFFKRLEGTQNRFAVIADYFGQGVFNQVGLLDHQSSSYEPCTCSLPLSWTLPRTQELDAEGSLVEMNILLLIIRNRQNDEPTVTIFTRSRTRMATAPDIAPLLRKIGMVWCVA